MYSLVLYKKSKEKDVVKTSCVRTKNDGNQEAKSGNKYYAVKVLKGHDDPKFLGSLDVTTDGEIVVPKKAPKPANTLQKQRADQSVKEKSKASDEANDELQRNLLCAPDIFTLKEEQSCNQNDAVSTANSTSTSTGDRTSKSESQLVKQTAEKVDHGGALKDQIPNVLNCPLCSPQTRIPDDSAEYFINIGEYLKSRRNGGTLDKPMRSAYHKRESDLGMKSSLQTTNDGKNVQDVYALICPPGSDMVELIPNSGVCIKATDKFIIDRIDKKEPRDILRELLRKIVGEENLCKMTLSGRSKNNNFVAVPEKELVTIQAYVESVVKPKNRLKPQEVKDCVTALCNSIRQDQKRKDERKNDGSLKIKVEGKKEVKRDVEEQILAKKSEEIVDEESDSKESDSEETEEACPNENKSRMKETLQGRNKKKKKIEKSWKNHGSSDSEIESVGVREDKLSTEDNFSDCNTTRVHEKILTAEGDDGIVNKAKRSSQNSMVIHEIESQTEQPMPSPRYRRNSPQSLHRISPEKNSTSQSSAVASSWNEHTNEKGPKKNDSTNEKNHSSANYAGRADENHKQIFSEKSVTSRSSIKLSKKPDLDNCVTKSDGSECLTLDNQCQRDHSSSEDENNKLFSESKEHHRSHSREKLESKDMRKDKPSRNEHRKRHFSRDRDTDSSTRSKKRHQSRSRERSNSRKRHRHHHKSSRHSSKSKKSKKSHHRSHSRD